MLFFECCTHCVPPKRHVGCHTYCKDYLRDRKLLDERNAAIRKSKYIEGLVYKKSR